MCYTTQYAGLNMSEEVVGSEAKVNRKTVSTNILWRFLERFGAYIVSFIVSIVLARILDPSTYGVVALMTVVITFLDVFVTGGFANALIYDKTATDKDFNTLFVFNVCFSLTLYIALFFCSPLIAEYYAKPALTWLIRIAGISLLINGIKNLQYAYVSKKLEFKKFFFATIGGTIASGIVGIILAIRGYGAWALVVQGVANHFVDSLILWIVIKWKPKIEFSFKLFKKHFSFGLKILIYKIIYNISNSVRQLAIGKKYSDEDLAFYNRGKTYPNMIGQNITSSVNSVMYPVLAKTQDDKKRFNEILERSFKINTFVMLPICVGFFCVAESFIHILLGANWLPAVPYVKIFCIVVYFNSVEAIFSNGPMALGKSTASMVLGILECLINIGLLIAAIPFGVMAIGYSMLISSAINCLIYFIYLWHLSRFNFLKCFVDSYDSLLASILMGVLVIALGNISLPFYIVFLIQVVAGIFAYFFLSKMFNNKSLPYCTSLLKDLRRKKKNK